MIKIKVSIPGFGGNLNISQYVGNDDGVWGDARFYVNDSSVDEVDYWFVIDDLWHSVEEVRLIQGVCVMLMRRLCMRTAILMSIIEQGFSTSLPE